MAVDPKERAEIERQLLQNGYVTVDEVPFTPKQLALLNWHKLKEVQTSIEDIRDTLSVGVVSHREFADFKRSVRTLATSVIGAVVAFATILTMVALA